MKTHENGSLLHSVLEPVCSSLNAEAAQKLLHLKADRKTQARVAKLAEKCNEGDLTPEERHEYEMYVMANHFIAMLQAEARLLLARKGQPA
jgi:ATP-dependent helicase/DNAse subunit B